MKVLLIAGHGNGDVGAVGNGYQEYKLTRELVNLIAPRLRKYCEVDIYNQDRNAYQDVQNGTFKATGYKYVLEIHFNAFNISAHGTECFVIPEEKGITVEQEIMKRMGKYFKLRDNDNIFDGVKRTRFAVINNVKKQGGSGAILEVCFIDNASNIETYQTNKLAIADDIVEGIVVGFGLKEGVSPTPPVTIPPAQTSNFSEGETVLLKTSSTVYQGASKGVKIPESYKNKQYTVKKISSSASELLLSELNSWVLASECEKATNSNNSSSNTLGYSDWVARLQKECNAQGYSNQKVDGIAGKNTLAGCPQLSTTSKGSITKLIQERLSNFGYSVGKIDGSNGPNTQKAIKQFQKDNGLKVDGVVGTNTWKKLLRM